MQTNLHGRDLISDLDFSKEEVETVLEVAFDLKRKRALNEPHAYLRDKALALLFFFSSTRTRSSFEVGMAHLGGHAAFIELQDHPDCARRHGQRDRADLRALLRRHRHPPLRLGRRQPLPPRGGPPRARPGAQHAGRHLPPLPDPGGPDDHHRKEGPRPAPQEAGGLLGLCLLLPETPLGAAEPDPADAALWAGCGPGPPARVPADARRSWTRRANRRASTAPGLRWWRIWMRRSRGPTSSTPNPGDRWCRRRTRRESARHHRPLPELDHR